jgi:hypothetical protein
MAAEQKPGCAGGFSKLFLNELDKEKHFMSGPLK